MKPTEKALLGFEPLFSENFSENKPKRGRPGIYTESIYERYRELRAKTARGKQNYLYAELAKDALSSDIERFAYLLKPKLRSTILAELGRLGDAETIRGIAGMLCESKCKTGMAVAKLRLMRGKSKPNVSNLKHAILQAVNRYINRHPTITGEQIREALWEVFHWSANHKPPELPEKYK